MDRYVDRVPVRTEGSGTRYDGRVWYEHINTIKSVNGKFLDPLTPVQKSDLKHGDRVRLQYGGKIFDGVIDFVSLPLSPEQEMRESPTSDKQILSTSTSPRKRKSTSVARLVQELEVPAPKKSRKRAVAKKEG